MNIKSIYLRNLVEDFFKWKKVIAAVIIVFSIAFAALGVKKANQTVRLTEEQQKEIDTYHERIAEYDAAIADVEKSLEIAAQQVDEVQKYIDHSIYMKIDPRNIQTATVQYGVTNTGNVGNILNAFILYVNEGGLKEALSKENQNIDVGYLKEIISCSTGGNVLNIIVIHHDSEQAQAILEQIKTHVQNQVPEIKKVQGEFVLQELDTSSYAKVDVNVMNVQNNNRNNLKNYSSSKADFENKLLSNKNNRATYSEKNEPEVLAVNQPNKVITIIAYVIVGILFGIVLPIMLFVLQYIFGGRIRRKSDLNESGIHVIGTYGKKKQYEPSLERSFLDLELLAKQQKFSSVYLNSLCDDEDMKMVTEDYARVINQGGIQTGCGSHVYEDAEELKQMIACGSCMLFAQAGKTTFAQIEQQIKLCQQFQVKILGCVLVE